MSDEVQNTTSYETNSQRKLRLKTENLWVLKWFCRMALLFSCLIFIDFILPPEIVKERIIDSWHTHGGRQSISSVKVQIETGQRFSIYPNQSNLFRELNTNGEILVEISRIFRMVLRVINESQTKSVTVSMMHSYLAFIPGLMFLISLIGVIANNRVDTVYNMGSMSLVMIVINFSLIFFVIK